ncbi:hypothetical protein [Streptomyces cacaoi]|uniref:hypothetical protein n=1 Tax=Streptomyces cacaoi TaxID=1898 RepID=UPI00260DD4B2|nr:hypothetical protein [Streptomyces cacaoi]
MLSPRYLTPRGREVTRTADRPYGGHGTGPGDGRGQRHTPDADESPVLYRKPRVTAS